MFARARASKSKTIVFAWGFVSKRIKTCQTIFLFDTPGSFKWLPDLEMAPRTLQILTNRVKKCQTVSKSVKKQWKCKKTQCFCRVTKRIKTCQKTVACQNVSNKYQKSVKKSNRNVSKHVKTCQKIPRCGVSCQNISKNRFLTLFDTFFDTRFCLLGHVPYPPQSRCVSQTKTLCRCWGTGGWQSIQAVTKIAAKGA